MGVDTHQVFLVPGQKVRAQGAGKLQLSEEIEHQVVVAPDGKAALQLLSERMPAFKPLGFTSLKEFEDAVVKLRATLNGESTGWPVLVHPTMG